MKAKREKKVYRLRKYSDFRYELTIPTTVVESLGWDEKDEVFVKVYAENGRIIVEPIFSFEERG